MSAPRRIPPSIRTSARPPTARTTSGRARIVGAEHAFGQQRAFPDLANPAEVVPRHYGPGQRVSHTDERHGAFSGQDHVFELRPSAVQNVLREPSRPLEKL